VFNLTITVGSQVVERFNGLITVFLPYSGNDTGNMKIYYLGADGKPVLVPGTRYDSTNKGFVFTTNHFSLYFISNQVFDDKVPLAPRPWTDHFTDVNTGDWFYDAVRYAYVNNLMNGVSNTEFEPGNDLTRAMLVTILYRYEGEPAITSTNKFSDVPSG